MLKIGALAIFFLNFATINGIRPLCEENPHCRCISVSPTVTHVSCHIDNLTKYNINVKSYDYLQITCENWDGWEDLNYTSNLTGNKLDTVQFIYCGISDEISLRDIIDLFGVKDVKSLIFQSYKNLNGTLKRKHLAGFPKVKKLNLSNNGLTNLPKDLFMDFPKLEWISLSDNNVILHHKIFNPTPNLNHLELCNNTLKIFDFRLIDNLKNLTFLDLMGNELTEIQGMALDDTPSLEILLLEENNLTQLSLFIFNHLKQLQLVDISMNNFSYIPPKLFDENRRLQKLFFHDNKMNLTTLPDYLLSNFTMLLEVFLYNNGFKILPENLFWGSTSLIQINLNENMLKTLPVMIFKGLRNIQILEMKFNRIKSLPDYIFKDMVNLDTLELNGNNIITLTNDLFQGLTSLTLLNMGNNSIKTIEPTAFSPMKKLVYALLYSNRINIDTTNETLNPFYNNTFLEELYLQNNSIKSIPTGWPIGEDDIKILDLRYNNITTVMADDLLIPSDGIRIDLRYNQIKNFVFQIVKHPSKFFNKEREINVVIDGNPILCDCHLYDILLSREKKITNYYYKYFIFHMTNLSCVKRDGTRGPRIKKLRTNTYLCPEDDYFKTKQICQNDCTCSMRLIDMTRIMDCSNKRLSRFWIDQSKMNFDQRYPLIINLTGNFLKEIPSFKILFALNVTTLLLSNNNISQITLDNLPKNLQILHLHNNNISSVTSNVMDYLKSKSLKEFTFRGNPIKCDCHTRDFYLFVQAMRYHYSDFGNLTCKNMSRPLYLLSFNDLVCPPEPRYYSGTMRNIFISFFVVILLTFIVLLWYFRKNIRARFLNNVADNSSVLYTRERRN